MNIHIPCSTTHYQLKWLVSMCVVYSQNCATRNLKNFASHMTLFVWLKVNCFLWIVLTYRILKFCTCLIENESKSRSGGIAVLVKVTIFEHVKILNSCSENVLWFTVKNSLFHELVLFGTIYIPPESSSYSNISIFESNSNDIVSLNPKNNHKICLIGDFNAHTSNAEDFI